MSEHSEGQQAPMRTRPYAILVGVVAVVVLSGMVLLALIGWDGVSRRPWLPIAIGIVGFGAVGAIILTTIHAMATEQKEAFRTHDEGASS